MNDLSVSITNRMSYTGRGDGGKTSVIGLNGPERVSKDDDRIQAMGDLDELSSVLGLCRAKARYDTSFLDDSGVGDLILSLQRDISVIQTVIAGGQTEFSLERTRFLEGHIDSMEKNFTSVNDFVIPGGTEMSAYLDMARAISRRAERSTISFERKKGVILNPSVKVYLNRLSSLLFTLARLSAVKSGIKEEVSKRVAG